ncbi:hypothetical protein Q9L58_007012 [Maublancomyces gigas]|uniref:Uncharacterized protein n=1 Tax=Discina gigas TaxID=1032678 RepID=A0ABR3GDT6_9PEZI
MASSSIDPNAQVPDNFYPAPQESSVSGQLSSSTSVNTSPTCNTESLDRIRSVPVILSVTYVHGHSRGSINCHYLLPPPPEVDPIHLNGGRVVPGSSMLPVSDDTREGLLRDAWLDIGMDVVWEELMMSLIAEYAGAIGDIGLSIWEWRWVKTEWNMEALNPQASLRDIIELFLLTNPAAGTPLILSPVLGDDIPYSNQPSVEFEVPVVPENSYLEEEISQGNNTEFMIRDMEQNRSDEDMGDEVDSPGTLAHPSPIAEELEFEDPIGGASSGIGEPVDTGNPGSSHLPLPAYWIRTGNSMSIPTVFG